MSDLKFACPTCQQHIAADEGYAGVEINCPACNSRMVVPGGRTPAPPPAPYQAPVPAPQAPTFSRTAAEPPQAAATSGCPSCGAALPRGAVMCTRCGYNLATKKRIVAGKVVAAGARSAPSGDAPWYKTPYPYVGTVLVVLGVLYFLGKSHPPMMMAFIGTALLYALAAHICVIVAAFQESVGTGFLTLCLPFYAFYFVFKVSDNSTLQLLYSVAIVINIALKFLPLE